jgi:hypothetical protein
MKSWRIKLLTVMLALFAIPALAAPVFAAGHGRHHKHHHGRRK